MKKPLSPKKLKQKTTGKTLKAKVQKSTKKTQKIYLAKNKQKTETKSKPKRPKNGKKLKT